MRTPDYKIADYLSFLESPLIIAFIGSGLIVMLRIVSQIVTEREKHIFENMENMGMSKWTYIMSTLTFAALVQLILAIVVSLILKAGVL